MKRRKIIAIFQILLPFIALFALNHYRGESFGLIAKKLMAIPIIIIVTFFVVKFLARIGVIDLKNQAQAMEHSRSVQKLWPARFAIAGAILGMILPFLIGTLLFANQSLERPGVWALDYPLITKWAYPLGFSILIFDIIAFVLVLRWTVHWFSRTFVSVVFLALLGFYWSTLLTDQPANLVFVCWALATMVAICWPCMAYRLFLDRVTPMSPELK